MDMPKRDIAWLVAGQLDRSRTYTEVEIDRLVRGTIREEFFVNPSLAPDHIRVAMVEAGYVNRDSAGVAYWVTEGFVGPEEEAERERALLRAASEVDAQCGLVVCPACGLQMGATSLLGHCQRWHNWSDRWLRLIEKYSR